MRVEHRRVDTGQHEARRPGPADHATTDARCLLDFAH
jgi:hypothetical protein